MDPFYDKIRDITEKSKAKNAKVAPEELTPEEDARIDYWVEYIAKHIEEAAAKLSLIHI